MFACFVVVIVVVVVVVAVVVFRRLQSCERSMWKAEKSIARSQSCVESFPNLEISTYVQESCWLHLAHVHVCRSLSR
jgi:hypothetical protein